MNKNIEEQIQVKILKSYPRNEGTPYARCYVQGLTNPARHTIFLPTPIVPPKDTCFTLTGKWNEDPVFGDQFKISSYKIIKSRVNKTEITAYENNEESIARWPLTKAEKIAVIDMFGESAGGVLEKHPLRAMAAIEQHPKTWFEKLKKIGINTISREEWFEGCLIYHVRQNQNNGDTHVPISNLVSPMVQENRITPLRAIEMINNASEIFIRTDNLITLTSSNEQEKNIANQIARIKKEGPPPIIGAKEIIKIINLESENKSITYNQSQIDAATKLTGGAITLLQGGPGTGKTTVLKMVLKVLRYQNPGLKIQCCAATGQASQRMAEVTGESATTIHRLIASGIKKTVELDVLVIDEASFLGAPLTERLLKMLPNGIRILLVGDVNQLPSVDHGQIFSDLMQSNLAPVATLLKVHRFAEDSAIYKNAYRILRGEPPKEGEGYKLVQLHQKDEVILDRLVKVELPELIKTTSSLDQIQVISPIYNGVLGVNNLNRVLQRIMNPDFDPHEGIEYGRTIFCRGDRVIQLVNNDRKKVYNGDIGTVTHIDYQRESIKVKINDKEYYYKGDDLKDLSLAYALVTHKMQGSESEAVVFIGGSTGTQIFSRELYMTAITRAKKIVIDMLHPQAASTCLNNSKAQVRCTRLWQKLRAVMGKPVLNVEQKKKNEEIEALVSRIEL